MLLGHPSSNLTYCSRSYDTAELDACKFFCFHAFQQTASKAVVELCKNQSMGDGFQLVVSLAEIHVPRMWVERHPEQPDSQVRSLCHYSEVNIQYGVNPTPHSSLGNTYMIM